MEKPYAAIVDAPLVGPGGEMEEVVIGALSSLGFGHFFYTPTPATVQAEKSENEVWGGRSFTKSSIIEVSWQEDKSPPEAFEKHKDGNEQVEPLLVSVKLKDMNSDDQEHLKDQIKSILSQVRERANSTNEALKTQKPATEHGTSQWATLEDLKEAGYLEEETDEDLGTRLLLGKFKGHRVSVPKKFTEAHAILAGPPGSGKSRTIIIPNIVSRVSTSMIITEVTTGEDIKPLLYNTTAGYRKEKGHKVFYLNPSDLKNSTRFNIIDSIKGIDDAIYYSKLLITNTTAESHVGDQIWTQSESHLLTALLLYAWGVGNKEKSVEGGLSNLGYVRSLLRLGPVGLNEHIAKTGIPEAKDMFDEFLKNSSPNFRLGVFSGLIQRLNPWLNPKIAALTEVSDFSPEDLKSNLFTFYLAYPVHREDYQPIMALACNYLANLALRESFEHPLTLLLDEFAAYGRIPRIDVLQATVRNRGIGMVFGFQDQEQLTKIYSRTEAEVIFTNTDTKILFATGSVKAQRQISQMLGQTTKVKKNVSSSGHISRQSYAAPLLSPSEVGTIENGKVLILRTKKPPILLDTFDPGANSDLHIKYPPPELPEKKVGDTVKKTVEEAKDIEFSKSQADKQADLFSKLYEKKTETEASLENAISKGSAEDKLEQLKSEQEIADKAFDSFVTSEELVDELKEEERADQISEKSNLKSTTKEKDQSIEEDDDPYSGMYH